MLSCYYICTLRPDFHLTHVPLKIISMSSIANIETITDFTDGCLDHIHTFLLELNQRRPQFSYHNATNTWQLDQPMIQTLSATYINLDDMNVCCADLPPLVLWHNRQIEAHLVLRPKSRNRHGDFEAQIIKPEPTVLRPIPGNPPPTWLWGSTKKPTAGFGAKPGETVTTSLEAKLEKIVATSFEAKLEKTVVAGFEAKPLETIAAGFEVKLPETVATGFEAKLAKTVWVVLRPNHSQTIAIGFEAKTDEKPSQWFWGQTTNKPSILVLRLNQETRTPSLHVHGADRTRRHPTSRLPGHQVPNLCNHPRSSAPGLLLLPWSSSLHAMPHLPPAYHETSKRDSPNETKIKEKQNKTKLSWIQIQTSPSQWLIIIKPRNWPLGFSISSLMSPLTTKEQSLRFKSKTPWSTARRSKKPRKAQEGHLEEGKQEKPANGTKSGKVKKNGKEELRKAQKSKKSSNQGKSSKLTLPLKSTPPNTLNASSLP
jgi:hypothetical protein